MTEPTSNQASPRSDAASPRPPATPSPRISPLRSRTLNVSESKDCGEYPSEVQPLQVSSDITGEVPVHPSIN
eukprot:gene201-11624_t